MSHRLKPIRNASSGKGRFMQPSGNLRTLKPSSGNAKRNKLSKNGRTSNGKTDASHFNRHSTAPRKRNSTKPFNRSRRRTKRKYGNSTIDIAYFIRQASLMPKPKQHGIEHKFDDFNFAPVLSKNLNSLGFETPTPIQDQSIPHILNGRDVIGLANTGTGKTGAFMLPLINKITRNKRERALVIAPTRELAIQIDEEFRKFSRGMRIFSAVCIGGSPIFRQIKSLRRNPNIVIGTPGRLEDLQNRKELDFSSFNFLVLDEVDRMLDMGFIDSIRKILDQTPSDRQSLFFSATMPPAINSFAKEFLNNPVTIEISRGKTAHNVVQDVIKIKDRSMKLERLKNLLSEPELEKVLIFSETKRDVEHLTQTLFKDGFKVDSIHGDKRQRQRQKSLTHFRNNKINILVATDVAARGLDIKDVTHVINYTVPQTFDDYIHRIGRTGRGNNKGIALTFV